MRFFYFLTLIFALSEPGFTKECSSCKNLEGFISPEKISKDVFKMVGKHKRTNSEEAVEIQKQRGVIITGTSPAFPLEIKCPLIDSEEWAIDYSHKRKGAALHKGIDIPQPKGTPVLAAASGTVVGKFMNVSNKKGIEIVLRHTPEQTGLPFYTYTQYTHLLELPSIPIGTEVSIGDEIAKIWNTGVMGKRERRSALHFAVFYSESPNWSNSGTYFAPKNGYFMDPVSFYSLSGPYESKKVRDLSRRKKRINVPYKLNNGTVYPSNAKKIWPFACKKT